MLPFLLLVIFDGTGIAPDFVLAKARVRQAEIRGSALVKGELWTWGERLERWQLPGLRAKTLGKFDTKEGGCVADVDGDGRPEVVAPTAAGLAVFMAPRWRRVVIDEEAETFECLGVTLLGHRGVLVVHRGMQVRFYERPPSEGERWPYREIYSFYTPSHQGGLLLQDVDGDGVPDLFCGNYWLQSPAAFELPWRLFAINTWSERPLAAWARSAWMGKTPLWAESRAEAARVALFRMPEDPRVLWTPSMVELAPRALAYPRGVANWRDRFFVLGEDNGAASRLLTLTLRGEARVVERGQAVRGVWTVDAGFVAVGPRRVAFFRKTSRGVSP